jgi:hypothetical protein
MCHVRFPLTRQRAPPGNLSLSHLTHLSYSPHEKAMLLHSTNAYIISTNGRTVGSALFHLIHSSRTSGSVNYWHSSYRCRSPKLPR